MKSIKKITIFLAFIFSELSGTPPPSLTNFGLTCYMNSAIQLLYAIEPLNTLLLSSPNFDQKKFAQQYTNLVQAIKKNDYYDQLKTMSDLVQDNIGCGQNDLFRFFSLLLKELITNSSIKDILQSTIKYPAGTYVVNNLTISASKKSTLLEAFKATFNPQKTIILKPAPILILHLNRDQPSPIEIPYTFSIKDFVDSSYTQPTDYELLSAAIHVGTTLRSGHWVTYARHNNQWYLCNDTQISNVTNTDGTLAAHPALNLSFWCVYQLKTAIDKSLSQPQIEKSFTFKNLMPFPTQLEKLIDSLTTINQELIK